MPDDEFDQALGEAISGQVGSGDAGNTGNTGDSGTTENASNAEDTGNTGKRQDVKNYPFYIPVDLREELDQLYNRYDGKNKVEGGEGIEKHREFLEPIMRAAIDDLELDDIVPYEPDE